MFEWVWDESLWFPKNLNLTWKDFENHPEAEGYLPQLWDLNWSMVLAVALLVVRFTTERVILRPLGLYFGVSKGSKHLLAPKPALESTYRQMNTLQKKDLERLAKVTDMTEKQIQIWFRKRKQNDSTKPINKFTECGWLCLVQGSAFFGGLCVLWDKPWFADTKQCWIGWPKHYIASSVYWYFMLEAAFYWSLVFTMPFDNNRKDFKRMFGHHVVTLSLIYFSWISNTVRAGALVLCLHDAADPLLAATQLCRYTALSQNVSTGWFVCFVVVWTISRLYLYPVRILYSITVESFNMLGNTCYSYWFGNVLMYLLMALHLMWTYTIAKISIKRLSTGQVEDIRSDVEDIESDDKGPRRHNCRAVNPHQ